MKIFDFFRKYMGKMVGAGAEIFDKLEPEPEPKFLTSRSRAAQKWTGSATLIRTISKKMIKIECCCAFGFIQLHKCPMLCHVK
jgi:hypothetical protein